MGDRYYVNIKCSVCERVEPDWYYAPTSELGTHFECDCGHVISLEKYTGISYKDASNLDEIEAIIQEARMQRDS